MQSKIALGWGELLSGELCIVVHFGDLIHVHKTRISAPRHGKHVSLRDFGGTLYICEIWYRYV